MLSFFRKRPWLVYAPIVVAPFILFGIPLLSGKVLYWGTAGLQFVPWREYAYVQLGRGVLPLWNPLNGMGAPLVANYQLAFFYPPGWLTIIGHWLAGAPGVAWVYTLLVPLHLAWAGLGMALLLRSIGVRELGQVVAGLAFSLCGFFVARATFFSMIWAGAWLPWVVWGASGIGSPFTSGTNKKRYFWFVLCVAAMLLAGHAQLSWYILIFTGAWVFFGVLFSRGIKQALLGGLIFIGLVAAAVLLAGIQLAPTFEYLLQSQRAASYDFNLGMTYSFWPWRFLTFFNPELFGNPGLGDYWGYASYWEDAIYLGIIPLFLALRTLPGIFKRKGGWQNGIIFLWVMILVSFLFALGSNTPVFPWLFRHVPTFGLFQAPARWMILAVASLCILAGISINGWRRPEGKARRNLNLMTFGFFAVLIGAVAGNFLLPDLKPGLMRGFMIFGMAGVLTGLLAIRTPADGEKSRMIWASGLVLVLILDLLGASLFLNTFISSNFFQPMDVSVSGLDSQISSGRMYISAADEYDLKFGKYLKFNDTRYTCEYSDIRIDLLPNLNILDGISSANNFDPFVPSRYDRWMQEVEEKPPLEREKYLAFMGVSAVIERNESGDTNVKNLSNPPDGLVEAYPCVRSIDNEEQALVETSVKVERGEESGTCLIVETSSVETTAVMPGVVEISAIEQGFDYLKFRIDVTNPTWLRIANTWYPGWHAKVDENSTPVFRADYIYSGFQVPAGRHEVLYYYRPASFIIGIVMSLTGIMIAAFLGWVSFRRTV